MESLAQSVTVSEMSGTAPDTVRRETVVWQKGLLPFMTYFIVMMAIAFFLFSGIHVYEVSKYIQTAETQDIRSAIAAEFDKPTAEALTAAERSDHALLLLEAETLDRRYHHAGGMLMARIWSRQLAFITGMVLAFVGAVFILGKLNEMPAQVSGEGAQMKVSISTASPGLILSFFGTVLIISSLFVPASLDVTDGAAYLGKVPSHLGSSGGPATLPSVPADQPLSLDDMKRLENSKETKRNH